MNPDLDLTISRVIRAPRDAVWRAWTDPARLERWFVPAPAFVRVERLEPVAGGAFLTSFSEDGVVFGPHIDGAILIADEGERLVYTTGLDHELRPASEAPIAMTAVLTFDEHPDGTEFRAVVRHGSAAARAQHEEYGFADGWYAVTEQLAELVEAEAAGVNN